jgi:uncharacterized protein (TIGR00725 family)
VRVSVVGGSRVDEETAAVAERVGRLLGERGHELYCGGLGGVMAAACRGAREAGGRTVGILPGEDPAAANPHVAVPVATGLGDARNALVVLNGEGVIAVDGGPGTCSELGLAGAAGRPVAALDSFDLPWVRACERPRAAVEHVERAVER